MSSVEAARKANLIGAAAAYLLNHGGRHHASAHWCFVPGRIEVLGKHTDYAGGRSLICAAERGFCAVGVEREDAVLRMCDVARHDTADFPLHADLVPNRLDGAHLELFGQLAHRSQLLGTRQLGNQVAPTEWLAETAERLGAAATSAFGAGFGGSVWALIHANQADSFLADWHVRYAQAYPHEAKRATFFATRPGPAAIA